MLSFARQFLASDCFALPRGCLPGPFCYPLGLNAHGLCAYQAASVRWPGQVARYAASLDVRGSAG
eukprot:8291341-Alexandrium_andersonii.AAC.1